MSILGAHLDEFAELLEDWGVADHAAGCFPCVFDDEHSGSLEIAGGPPVLSCVGLRVTDASADVRAAGERDVRVTVGDTLSQVRTGVGAELGPFTVQAIEPDGSGLLLLILSED